MTQELLHTILEDLGNVLVIALFPFVAKYFISFLQKAKENLAERIKNDKVEATVLKVLGIVENAVEATNQTFVSEVKKNGGLTEDNKKEAYDKTVDTVKTLLTNDVIDLIVEEYGDLDVYLDTLMEKIVREKK